MNWLAPIVRLFIDPWALTREAERNRNARIRELEEQQMRALGGRQFSILAQPTTNPHAEARNVPVADIQNSLYHAPPNPADQPPADTLPDPPTEGR